MGTSHLKLTRVRGFKPIIFKPHILEHHIPEHQRCAPGAEPVVLAGDLNLDVNFPGPGQEAEPAPGAAAFLAALDARCGLQGFRG